jgi:hypothetical protein
MDEVMGATLTNGVSSWRGGGWPGTEGTSSIAGGQSSLTMSGIRISFLVKLVSGVLATTAEPNRKLF